MAKHVLDESRKIAFHTLLRALRGEVVDWSQCDQEALRIVVSEHRLGQFLLSNNLSHAKQKLPWLLTHCQQQKQYALQLTSTTIKLVDQFESQGIRVICLKGCALSQLLYNDPAARYFRDIDLLIHPDDFPECHKILCTEGYQAHTKVNGPIRKLQKWTKDCVYRHSKTGHILELHWRLSENTHWSNSDFDDLWGRRQGIQIGYKKVFLQGWEDLVLHQVMHGANHMWSRLQWLLDYRQMLFFECINWHLVSTKANAQNLQVPLRCVVWLLQEIFMAPVAQLPVQAPSHRIQKILKSSLMLQQQGTDISLKKRWLQLQFFWLACPSFRFQIGKWYALLRTRVLWLAHD